MCVSVNLGNKDIANPKKLSSSLSSGPRISDVADQREDNKKQIGEIRKENAELAVMGFADQADETNLGVTSTSKVLWAGFWIKSRKKEQKKKREKGSETQTEGVVIIKYFVFLVFFILFCFRQLTLALTLALTVIQFIEGCSSLLKAIQVTEC